MPAAGLILSKQGDSFDTGPIGRKWETLTDDRACREGEALIVILRLKKVWITHGTHLIVHGSLGDRCPGNTGKEGV